MGLKRLISWLYCLFVTVCRCCYERGIFKSKQLPCVVISIGNIVAGGTGKTPAVIAIAEILQRASRRVAVLSRGYRNKLRGEFAIVSDGKNILLSPEAAGDEAYMLAQTLKKVPVLVGKERFAAGLAAIKRWQIEVILLDDGVADKVSCQLTRCPQLPASCSGTVKPVFHCQPTPR